MEQAVIIFGVTGLIGFTTKVVYTIIMSRNADHKLMRELPSILKLHANEHKSISHLLEVLQRSNLSHAKSKLLEKYSKAKENGYISAYELDTWHLMYDSYREMGGNGFIETLKEQIDDIPIRKE